ncbi:MAG: DNA/RNA nuclease SfsA [Clostridiaceae bacterium]|jgi:sugar fermentation stimulation protein A|nr:DNA/RNA nuclease SfsA [Clostridiaceae bacterium]
MKYKNTTYAKFIDRRNRFIAQVELDGKVETVHVKNTGRCKELLLPGSDVVLSKADNPARKTQYDLVTVYKKGLGWVNIDSQAPNQVVKEWLNTSPELFENITFLKPEYTYGKTRVDFYLECDSRRIFIEVKGCTLEIEGIGYFPDAPTERGVRHLYDLAEASEKGYECYIAFVISMPGVRKVLPNVKTHPEFGMALTAAKKAGVKVLYLPCNVKPDQLSIADVVMDQ